MLNLSNRRLLFWLTAPFLAFFLAACTDVCIPLDVTPENDTNPVGTQHTITASIDEDDTQYDGPFIAFFLVIAGPNSGANSLFSCEGLTFEECNDVLVDCENSQVDCPAFICLIDPSFCGADECETAPTFEDLVECVVLFCTDNPEECGDLGDCDPVFCVSPEGEDVEWTYRSNGDTGTDSILVCGLPLDVETDLASQLSFIQGNQQLITDQQFSEEELTEEEEAVIEDETGCEVVEKKWVDEEEERERPTRTPTPTPTRTPTPTPTITPTSQPGRAAVIDAILPSQRATATPTQAPAIAQPQQQAAPSIVRPPNTGGAGLR
jgi:hypothetical protein